MRGGVGMGQGFVGDGGGGAVMDMEAEDQAGAAVEDGTGSTHDPVLAAAHDSSATDQTCWPPLTAISAPVT